MNDTQDHNKNGPGLSRREFLRGTGAAAAASAALGVPALPVSGAPVEGKAVAIGPGAVEITLDVNGEKKKTKVEPRVTLLDALRNYLDTTGKYLDTTGCKRVCDRGTCGACTVLLDGKPVYSCTLLALEAQGKAIKTAESLVNKDKLDAVPAAFVHADAQQCGFCTPGFVVAMKAVFLQNPKATPAEVEEGLAGNICRCGTYEQMRHAIAELCKKGG